MYFLFSGEGPTDLGACGEGASACEAGQYQHGPMTVIVDHLVHARLGYSLLDTGYYAFLSRRYLTDLAKKLKWVQLPGKKGAQATATYYRNARALASYARAKQAELEVIVIAVLFRDSDETASAGRDHWKNRWTAMVNGFRVEDFPTGVPMIPKPKSEAWLLCALKENPYQGCAALEKRSGSDKSPNSLKGELKDRLGHETSREELCGMVNDRTVDVDRIHMPSFDAFKTRLKEVLHLVRSEWGKP